MVERDEHELNDPYTKIIHEISAWKQCLPIIPSYIRKEDALEVAEHSIKTYITLLVGEQAVPSLLEFFKRIIGQK